jgi:ABC-type transport system involved in multi-copper enzyme maturation permease subunit
MRAAKPASVITLLAGVWLFVSPWVYGATTQNAWNSWIVGALMFIFALTRVNSTNSAGMSWLNTVLGAWVFASPWIFGYTGNTGSADPPVCNLLKLRYHICQDPALSADHCTLG